MTGWGNAFGNYESRIVADLDEPLGPDDLSHSDTVEVEVSHSGGRLFRYEVHGRFLDDKPVVEIWLKRGEELYLHPDVLCAIVNAISLATMPVVHWSGDVEGNVEGYGDE